MSTHAASVDVPGLMTLLSTLLSLSNSFSAVHPEKIHNHEQDV